MLISSFIKHFVVQEQYRQVNRGTQTMFNKLFVLFGLLAFSLSTSAQTQVSVTLSVALPPYITLPTDFFDPFKAQFPHVEVITTSVDMDVLTVNGDYDPLTVAENYSRQADVLMIATEFRAVPTLDLEATLAGYYLDLKPLIQSDPDFDPTLYDASVWQAFQWSQGFWALPSYYDLNLLHYDPLRFETLQLFPPDSSLDLMRWEQLLNDLDTAGIPLLDVTGNIHEIVWSWIGGGWLDLSTNPPIITVDSGYLATLFESARHWPITRPEGAINFTDYPLIYGSSDLNLPGYELALPPGGHSALSVTGFAVSAGTSQPELAYQLAKYLARHPQVNRFSDHPADQPATGILAEAIETAIVIPFSGMITVSELSQNPTLVAEVLIDDVIAEIEAAIASGIARRSSVQPAVDPIIIYSGETLIRLGVDYGSFDLEAWRRVSADFQMSYPDLPMIEITQPRFVLGDVINAAVYAEQFDCFYSQQRLADPVWLALTPWMQADSDWLARSYADGILTPLEANGQLYAYPLSLHPLVLFYDQTVIAEPPATIAELEVLLETYGPLQSPVYALESLLMLTAGYGGIPFDTRTDPSTFQVNTPEVITALETVLRLVRSGQVQYTGFEGVDWQNPTAPLIIAPLEAGFPPPYLSVLFPSPLISMDIGAGYISAASPHAEACYQLFAYAANTPSLFPIPAYRVGNASELAADLYDRLGDSQIVILPINAQLDVVNFYRKTTLYRLFDQAVNDPSIELGSMLGAMEEQLDRFFSCEDALNPAQIDYLELFLGCVAQLEQPFSR
jgi:ABC-type glycerol-3-phosphate transport system substrate-binding protein